MHAACALTQRSEEEAQASTSVVDSDDKCWECGIKIRLVFVGQEIRDTCNLGRTTSVPACASMSCVYGFVWGNHVYMHIHVD
jgi:hypothetical protein